MRKPLERDVQKTLLSYLSLRGVLAWRNNNTGVNRTSKSGRSFWTFAGLKGVADILAVLPPDGVLLAIECKREGGKPTAEQTAFLDSVRKSGGVAGVCCSLADLESLLEAAGVRL